jgi:hypothetical protein
MIGKTNLVTSARELVAATNDKDTTQIVVGADLAEVPPIRLLPGQTLCSDGERSLTLRFRENAVGLQLTSDNSVGAVNLHVSPEARAIWNDPAVEDFGTIRLYSLRVVGRVQILAKEKVRKGRVEVDSIDIRSADARGEPERPHEYGVDVLQGAFTLWNMQPEEEVVLTGDLVNLRVGRFGESVRGSGVFVSGAGNRGGRLNVQRLETKAIYINGGIPPSTPNQITAGVFVVHGAYVDRVINHGPIVTS